MPYRIRVLGTSDPDIPIATLEESVGGLEGNIELVDGSEQSPIELLLKHADGVEIAVVERNPVTPRELAEAELQEFAEEVMEYRPARAAVWLKNYFPKVKVIYAFQLLNGTDHKNGWEILGELKDAIWNRTGGILQADLEGFSNEQGHHILWQFSDSAHGEWFMAVQDDGGNWVPFVMELGDPAQRSAFLAGKVPHGAKTLK
jgi:hypothetical protein